MKHSTLANADDLHYAKLRTFTGDPALIAADFPDQILVASDSNKIYRATDSGLIELVAKRPQGEGAGAIFVGEGYPTYDVERSVGALYFDILNSIMFVCTDAFSEKGWTATQNNLELYVNISRISFDIPDSDIELALYYSETPPYAPFDFTQLVDSFYLPSINQYLGKIHKKLGYYALACLNVNRSVNLIASSNNPSGYLQISDFGSGNTAEGQPIGGDTFVFEAYPSKPLGFSLTLQI